ncbi:CAAX amino terminal protease self- immunity [Lacunisphaera limnophila]|uniref:CAAX amino terminal protease self-immunity n=1 Tax=Lacunisphaera limnophila TaxID=1838286 RepID=A0A1D8AXN1_9BACT|nr:CPBP family intramembrane glutamic endopeptidase [Lacunisphaera limnophila]AOS45649.1 CAAX amino terminal protease self- immunity [Lacunisphaera limnophila]
MPDSPAQIALLVVELALLFSGAGLLLWLLGEPRRRQRWLSHQPLPHWPVTVPEFLFAGLLVFAGGFLGQTLVQTLAGARIAGATDRTGLELFVYGAAFHLGILGGCALFPVLRRRLYSDYGSQPAPFRPGPTLPWTDITRYAAGTVLVALPVLTVLSLGWTGLLRAAGLPDEPQDLIGIFSATQSPVIIAGMLLVACGLAPLSEELIFRAGLYRYLRQRLGRTPALLVSGVCFGALHGNWAGFLPLAVLGMILALAYEATGSIRVAIVAHSLFNLNTVLIVLSGLPQASP